ncbi:hypothetical protein OSTOST_08936 [Ostertagia ostertagi]
MLKKSTNATGNTTQVIASCHVLLQDLYSPRDQNGNRILALECDQPGQYTNERPFIETKMASEMSSNWDQAACFSSVEDTAVWIYGKPQASKALRDYEAMTRKTVHRDHRLQQRGSLHYLRLLAGRFSVQRGSSHGMCLLVDTNKKKRTICVAFTHKSSLNLCRIILY